MSLNVPFLECFKDATGGNQKVKQSEYEDEGLPVIDQGKKLIGGYSTTANKVNRKGEVIVFGDHSGTIKYIDFDFALGADGVKVIEPVYEKVYPKYAFYALKKVYIPDTGYDRKYKYLKRSKIPLPPLATQRRIAEVLDKADAIRKRSRHILDRYDQLAQSVFLEMFGDPVKNEKGWEVKKLQDVCDKITDGTHQSPTFLQSGIPFLFVSNIVNYEIDFNTHKYISNDEYLKLTKSTPIEIGDILYTSVGSYGNPAIVRTNDKFCFQRHIAHLKPNHKVLNSSFFKYLLLSNQIRNQADRFCRGVAQKTLNLKEIKNFIGIIPPINVQSQFASIVKQIEQQKAKSQAELDRTEELYQSLLQQAFTGDFFRETETKELQNA